ncbi:hypothetical protein SacglDRAFT_03561 [Saccharomonospora glauca K62]|uniref:Uncharacterized protein n=2 Tax=Saccharomonospora glauca TaxID=40990 RepID=I1D645_9PSEU|nr:hypothetical protein SacglDRAFT_03561 [Saccharomonospora glauca K62]
MGSFPGAGSQPGVPYPNSSYGQPLPGEQGASQQPRYGELPSTPPPMPVPPTPPKKSKTGAVVAAAVVAIAVVAGLVAVIVWKSQGDAALTPASPEAGECVAIEGSDNAALARPVDCSDPDALWQVAVSLDDSASSCPDGDYDEYSSYADGTKLCLTLNVETGDCLASHGGVNLSEFGKVDCTDAAAELEILVVEDGATDIDEVCGAIAEAFSGVYYSEPARVICFGHSQSV